MRFLVHHDNSTYDAATKRFYFNLDQRISNPTRIKVSKASYTASTTASDPQVIYMRSQALNDLIKAKHTVDLVAEGHENASDAIAVLEETHTTGRYRMQGSTLVFPVHSHTASSRKFDFYFTNNFTALDGVYTAPSVPGTTTAEMEAFVAAGDITVWIDMSKADAVLNTSLEQATVGESINRIVSRTPGGDLQLMASGTDKVAYTTLGEGNAVTQQVAAAWSYSIDGSGNPYDQVTGSHVFLLRSPPDATGLEVIWQSSSLHMFWWNDTLQYKNAAEAYVSTGLVVLDDTDYLLEVAYVAAESNWTLTKLSDNSVQTALNLQALRSPVFTQVKMISTAQSHQLGKFGDYVNCSAGAAADVVQYFKQVYTGAATEAVVDPDGKDATFFVQLDIDTS